MNAQFLSQQLLPIVLMAIMFAMGMSLKFESFSLVFKKPKAVTLGLFLQIFWLPFLAVVVLKFVDLPNHHKIGLILLSLAPGGVTSNLFSYLSKGNVALSISLTAIVSLIIPFSFTFLGGLIFNMLSIESGQLTFPFMSIFKQIILVTLIPLSIGMLLNYFLPKICEKAQPFIKAISSLVMLVLVLLLIYTNFDQLPSLISIEAAAVYGLLFLAFGSAQLFSMLGKVGKSNTRTLLMEVGIQNAGTAMLVAFTVLQNPAYALLPLFYGVVMNVPAFLTIAYVNLTDKNKKVVPPNQLPDF